MKHLILLLSISIIILSACSKENNSDKGLLSMDINGVNWAASNEVGAFIQTSTNKLVIDGSNSGVILTMGINNVTGLGTYSLTAISGDFLNYSDQNPNPNVDYNIMAYLPLSHGTLTITKLLENKSGFQGIEGTFSGVAYTGTGDSIIITNGKFRNRD